MRRIRNTFFFIICNIYAFNRHYKNPKMITINVTLYNTYYIDILVVLERKKIINKNSNSAYCTELVIIS